MTNSGAGAVHQKLLRATLWGGLAVGVLDAVDAVVFFRAAPSRVFQSVASGLLGRQALQGGLATALLGVLLHFLIAFTAAAVYVGASRRLAVLVRHPVPCGLAYGVAVFAFISQIVVPFSLARQAPFSVPWLLDGLVGHALLVGADRALRTTLHHRGDRRRAEGGVIRQRVLTPTFDPPVPRPSLPGSGATVPGASKTNQDRPGRSA